MEFKFWSLCSYSTLGVPTPGIESLKKIRKGGCSFAKLPPLKTLVQGARQVYLHGPGEFRPVSHLVEDTLKPPAGEHVAEQEGNGYNSNSRECGAGSELV